MGERRAVVTGFGLITPLGVGIDPFWHGLLEGRRVIRPITHFDASALSCRIAGEVPDFDPEQFMEKKEARRLDRVIQFAVAASGMALKHSGYQITDRTSERTGVLIGSGIGGLGTLETQHRIMIDRGPDRVSPFLAAMMIADMPSGMTSITYGIKGPNLCVVTACATGTNCLGEAARMIERGDVDAMLAGGAEAVIVPIAVAAFAAARALSQNNDDPKGASRPFDAHRDGFVMGEGAAVLMLEEKAIAQARGATIYGEIVGYASTSDAHHITAPEPEANGATRCMNLALKDAGMAPTDVDYINAHGTSTQLNDAAETRAIKQVFGDQAYKVPISSIKSITGHMLGAAGAVEAVACLLAMRDSVIPPTVNYTTPDPNCDLDYVPNRPRQANVSVSLSNSFGFGGHNACIVLEKTA